MKSPSHHLSRREREIMDILYRRGRATVTEVMSELSGGPAYSTVRAQLRVLEEKGHIRHEAQQLRYVYLPSAPQRVIRRSALKHLVDTFFEGSTAKLVTALLGGEAAKLSEDELDHIARLVKNLRSDSQ
jgi:predicted transcriptional regulator